MNRFRSLNQSGTKHRTQQRAESEIDEIDDASGRSSQLRRIRLFDDAVRYHGSTRGDAHNNSDSRPAQNAGIAEENPGKNREQNCGSRENYRFAAADAVRNETKERTTDHPTQGNRSGQGDGGVEFATASLLKETNSPRHPKNRSGNKQEAGNKPA